MHTFYYPHKTKWLLEVVLYKVISISWGSSSWRSEVVGGDVDVVSNLPSPVLERDAGPSDLVLYFVVS